MRRTLASLRECDVRPSKFDAFRCCDGCASHKYVDGIIRGWRFEREGKTSAARI